MYKGYAKGTKSLIYLLSCALNKESADISLIPSDELDLLFNLSHKHGVTAIAELPLEKSGFDKRMSDSDISRWTEYKALAYRRRALYDIERNNILAELDKLNIRYCPLKGVILQDLYPEYHMREMTDNDILHNKSHRQDIKNIMIKRGYSVSSSNVSYDDEYIKPPIYNFEFHHRLFSYSFKDSFIKYYENVHSRLIPNNDGTCCYHFSNEDFYIYITAHAYKHFKEGGIGFRTLTDTFIFNKAYKGQLDREYIKNELDKLGIRGFERMCRIISSKLFSSPRDTYDILNNLDEKSVKFLRIISYTGAFGSHEDHVKQNVKKAFGKSGKLTEKDRIKYYLRRVFPDEKYYKESHPFIYEHKYLIPPFLVFRAIKGPIVNFKKIIKEIHTIEKEL